MAEEMFAELEDTKVQLYQSVLGQDGWEQAARKLREVVRSDLVALAVIDQRVGNHVQLYGDCGEKYKQLYLDLQVEGGDPFTPALRISRQGDVILDGALPDFEQSGLFDGWMRPQHQHSGGAHNLTSRDGISAYFMFSRGGRAPKYTRRESAILTALNGTLAQVMDLHARLARAQLEQTGHVLNAQGVGWMAVDPDARLVWANDAADAMLTEPWPAITVRHGALSLGQASQTRQFLRALQAACSIDPCLRRGSDMIVASMDGSSAFALSIVPADNLFVQGLPALHGAYLGIQDLSRRLTPGFEDRVRSMFDLTVKEAQLAAALAMGQTVAEAATARGVSLATARTHLMQIFRKTGTGQQSQLVSLLLSVLPIPFVSEGAKDRLTLRRGH
jgi:DNA-binding CsgD family transcriptional regulator